MSPIVDVVMPACNAAATIRDALASLLKQTLQDIRIIVVDDGSKDATPEILAEMVRFDPRIETYRLTNAGPVDALNHGLSLCRAEYVARHEAGDLSDPERIETQFAFLRGNAGCVAIDCAVREIDGAGRSGRRVMRAQRGALSDPASVPSKAPTFLDPFMMARASAVKAAGGYRYAHEAQDVDLAWRLEERGELVNLDLVLGDHRPRGGSDMSMFQWRLMALNLELAALSAQRRRRGTEDLAFSKVALARAKAAPDLKRLLMQVPPTLRDDERAHLDLAVPAKLMELADQRQFELDRADCRVISVNAGRARHLLPAAEVASYQRLRRSAATRMLRRGDLAKALAILTPQLVPGLVGRRVASWKRAKT